MHIADGILPVSACVAAHAVSLAAVYRLGRKIEPEEVVRMGLLSSAVFVVSLIHFPIGGTSVHLGMFGLCGILLGRRAFPVVYATLLFQALMFQHGGLLSLGVNALNMGAGALAAAALWKAPRIPESLRALVCGVVGLLLPAILMAVEFSLAGYGKGFFVVASLYTAVALVEGALTVTIVGFVRRVKPAVLARVAACLLIVVGVAHAHDLVATHERTGASVIVRCTYAGTEAVSFAEVQVHSPALPKSAFQTGRTDIKGVFAFVPDADGEWRFIVDDDMGHRTELKIPVSAVAVAPANTTQPLWQKAMLGVSVILGGTGMLYGWKARRR